MVRQRAKLSHLYLHISISLAALAALGSLLGYSPKTSAITLPTTETLTGSIMGLAHKCLDNRQAKPDAGNPVQLYTCNGTVAQEWHFFTDATLRVQGRCLDVTNGQTIGSRVVIDQCTGQPSQLWNTTGKSIMTKDGALCIESRDALAVNSNPMWLQPCNNSLSQQWVFPHLPRTTALYEPADGKAYIGVAVNLANLAAFNQAAGIMSHPAIYNSFTGKDGNFQVQFDRLKNNPELTPMITWNVTFANNVVTNGSKDAYIQAAADSARAYGKPVFIRLNWEMNGFWSPNYDRSGGVSPTQYIAAWRYIHTIFQQTAPNVAFVWAPNGGLPKSDALGVPKLPLSNWYPGDSYTDWIGFSAYPEYSTPASTVLTKPEGLNYIADYAASRNKPLVLAEWARGTLTQPYSADTSVPFDLVFSWAEAHPDTVKGLVYFDNVDSRDHVLETHPVGSAAYRSYTVGNPRYLYDVIAN